jgi:hypothetical protein
MTDQRDSGRDSGQDDGDGPQSSILNVEAEAASVIGLGGPDGDDDDGMPEHEKDPDDTVGGGVMSEGGTAVDRGTGTLGGEAQGDRGQGDQGQGDRGQGD